MTASSRPASPRQVESGHVSLLTPIRRAETRVWFRVRDEGEEFDADRDVVYGSKPTDGAWLGQTELRATATKNGEEVGVWMMVTDEMVSSAAFDAIGWAWREMELKVREALGEVDPFLFTWREETREQA